MNERALPAAGADAAKQLAAARARLLIEKPFLGALLLHLPLARASGCASIATDARRIYYRADYIEGLSLRETQFVLAHQALHCALGHFARRMHRSQPRWDAACDYAVNQLLLDDGMTPPPGALLDPAFRGLSAEEIYPLLEQYPASNFDRHLFDAVVGPGAGSFESDGIGEPMSAKRGSAESAATPADEGTESDPEASMGSDAAAHRRRSDGAGSDGDQPAPDTLELERRWHMRLALAAQQARHAGRMSAAWQRLLGQALAPALPWRALLARFLAMHARDDYSFLRPSRRESDALLPSLRSSAIDLHAVLDTSGSVTDAELAAFAAELDALKAQVRARITLHACDQALAAEGPWTFEIWEPLQLPAALAGGGGTDFTPVFEWLRERGMQPDVLVYFTDAQGEFPAEPPPFPVAWLVKGNAPVPWGERIQLN